MANKHYGTFKNANGEEIKILENFLFINIGEPKTGTPYPCEVGFHGNHSIVIGHIFMSMCRNAEFRSIVLAAANVFINSSESKEN